MRYIKQRDCRSCGPVALLNVQKWRGNQTTYKEHFVLLCRACKLTSHGTFQRSLWRAAAVLGCTRVYGTPTAKSIDHELRDGNAVLVRNEWPERGGHYFLITRRTEKSFLCHNVANRSLTTHGHFWLPKRYFVKRYLKHHRIGPRIYRVTKDERPCLSKHKPKALVRTRWRPRCATS